MILKYNLKFLMAGCHLSKNSAFIRKSVTSHGSQEKCLEKLMQVKISLINDVQKSLCSSTI